VAAVVSMFIISIIVIVIGFLRRYRMPISTLHYCLFFPLARISCDPWLCHILFSISSGTLTFNPKLSSIRFSLIIYYSAFDELL
jgi:hypothetical protein